MKFETDRPGNNKGFRVYSFVKLLLIFITATFITKISKFIDKNLFIKYQLINATCLIFLFRLETEKDNQIFYIT